MLPSDLNLENLCTHHIVDRFDCGSEAFNAELRALHSELLSGGGATAYALARPDREVIAYIALSEIELTVPGSDAIGRYLLVPAVGVDRAFQNTPAFARLVRHGFDFADSLNRRRPESPLRGVACITQLNQELHHALIRLGFEQHSGMPFYVVNRIRE